MQEFNSEPVRRLFRAVSLLQTEEECKAFFEDICTIKEVLDMAQRLETAEKLLEGENYQDVSAQVGTSTATISRVSRCLKYGSGGYRLVLDRLRNEGKEQPEESEDPAEDK